MSFNFFEYRSRYRKVQRILYHLLFWTLFFGVQYYIGLVSFNALKNTPASYLNPVRITVCLMLVYYPLVYFVWPRFFAQKRYLAGIIAVLLLIVLYTAADALWEMAILQNCDTCMAIVKNQQPDYYDYLQRGPTNVILTRMISLGIVYQLILLLAPAGIIKIATAYLKQRMTALQLAKEKAELEFNFLKAQVNPHFLFNTLNNIYALVNSDKKERSAEMISRLANFMRYSLYSHEGQNTLEKEICMVTDYVELERIRLNNTVINFNYQIENPSMGFPPLLLMPLIENAFKYCVEETGTTSWILIQMNMTAKTFFCRISNTCAEETSVTRGGIGLVNVRKRLEQHYANRYAFNIGKEKNVFTATVQINLSA